MLTENLRNRRGAVKPVQEADERHEDAGHDASGQRSEILFARDAAEIQLGHDRVQVGDHVQSRLNLLNASRRHHSGDNTVREKAVLRAEAVLGISAR